MRELLTVIAIAILLAVGWKQSFRSHWYQLIGKSTQDLQPKDTAQTPEPLTSRAAWAR